MDLSIIIVSYNTKEFVDGCLESIYKTIKKIRFEVIVVDNDSKDGTAEYISTLRQKMHNLSIIKNKENLGFSKANNIGVGVSKGRYVLFLNGDVVLHENAVNGVYDFLKNRKEVGAATCKLIMPNGKIDDAIHRGFPTPWNAFSHFSGLARLFGWTKLFGGYNLAYLDLKKEHEIDALAGAFMMVKREAGEEVGWWDEDYFFYGEDLDFCFELKQKGWKIYFLPQFTALHYKGVAGGIKKISKDISTADYKTKNRASRARFNAMRIFYKKHYENKYPWFIKNLVYFGIDLKENFLNKI